MSAVTLMADIVILNMFLVVACLPVVTVGAAVRAASVVVRDMVGGYGSRYHMQFLRELVTRWKPVTLYWLLLVVALFALWYQVLLVGHFAPGRFALTLYMALLAAGVFIIAGISVWFFGLASGRWAGEGFRALFARAVTSTFYYLPRTIGAVGILGVTVGTVVALPIGWAVPLTLFLIPALALYLIRLVIAGALGERLDA